MLPEEKIKELKRLLFFEKALGLLYFQRLYEKENRTWEELSNEEREFRLEYAEHILKLENEEVFADE
ncbi:MAG: hypothetical protein ACYDHX_03995 [Methanothrix sp.]